MSFDILRASHAKQVARIIVRLSNHVRQEIIGGQYTIPEFGNEVK